MTRSQSFSSENPFARKIKEGRGAKSGKDYRPWFYVQEVPSQGRSHRIYSHKSERICHLLSDLELAVFLALEWSPKVVDIREQFPLRLEDTQDIASVHRLRHPCIRGIDQVMTSDFLVDVNHGHHPQFAIQVKPMECLSDPKIIVKLEVERRYWEKKEIPWYLITEREISL